MSKGQKIDVRGLAKLITGIEARDPKALLALSKFQRSDRDERQVIGITGPPGAGKSTLVDGMIGCLRKKGGKVGVVAIDPSSPFSGGALLGDRIRMQEHAGDPNVFIRSIGSRGSHGGLSRATRDIVSAMITFGMDYVIVETVGVGQTELDIMEIADATVVVLVPESGDMIQTMKAGLLEIADIFVVNKADRPGAEQMKSWLTGMFDTGVGLDEEAMKHHGDIIPPLPPLEKGGMGGFESLPVLLTQANRGKGVDELMKAVFERLENLKNDSEYAERKRKIRLREFFDLCADDFRSRLEGAITKDMQLKKLVSKVSNGTVGTYTALKVIDKFVKFGK